jgi:hypothetical protein
MPTSLPPQPGSVPLCLTRGSQGRALCTQFHPALIRAHWGQLKPGGNPHSQFVLGARLDRRRPSAAGFGCEQGGPGFFREDYELADSGARHPPRRAPSEATIRCKGRYARYHE